MVNRQVSAVDGFIALPPVGVSPVGNLPLLIGFRSFLVLISICHVDCVLVCLLHQKIVRFPGRRLLNVNPKYEPD